MLTVSRNCFTLPLLLTSDVCYLRLALVLTPGTPARVRDVAAETFANDSTRRAVRVGRGASETSY
jgi:hypothetical protein